MRLFSLFLVSLFSFTILLAQDVKDSEGNKKATVTFVELGSVNCIPCKKMQPVMKSIEKKYGEQIKVIFYDVWTDEGKPYSQKYKIKLIPTQVFLDKNGKEFFRHEGFFSEEDIDKLLKKQGLKPINKKL
ncbi:MAG TPA: thioredoxin family protein [Melioribacteraceae bacterium]|nr:thioredoxin family protein [Melioribacteraceae bacterium]